MFVDNAGMILLLGSKAMLCRKVRKGIGRCDEEQQERVLRKGKHNAQRHQIATRYITLQNTLPGHLEHHLISSLVCSSESATPRHFHDLCSKHFSHCLRLAFATLMLNICGKNKRRMMIRTIIVNTITLNITIIYNNDHTENM